MPAVSDWTVLFRQAYSAALPPMRADSSALGTLPTTGFRHCEPLRTASAYGWYVFPPFDISIYWNGVDIFFEGDGGSEVLRSIDLPDFQKSWDANCPIEMRSMAPAFMTALPARGVLQIWSGLLVSTKPEVSLLVRPLVNYPNSQLYSCYEGIVETDVFQPFPLFVNLQLLATNIKIHLRKTEPLFQVQPIRRDCYSGDFLKSQCVKGFSSIAPGENISPMSQNDWLGLRRTLRVDTVSEPIESGRYTRASRLRGKNDMGSV